MRTLFLVLPYREEPIFTPTTSAESSHASSAATSVYTDEEYIHRRNAARRTAETRAQVKALDERPCACEEAAESISPSLKAIASKNTLMTLAFGHHFNKNRNQAATYENIEGDDSASESGNMKDQARAQKKRSIPLVYRAVSLSPQGTFHSS